MSSNMLIFSNTKLDISNIICQGFFNNFDEAEMLIFFYNQFFLVTV